jgi:putative SOS response-associated peptidase YedK
VAQNSGNANFRKSAETIDVNNKSRTTGSGLAIQHYPCSESSWSLTILLVLLQDLTPLCPYQKRQFAIIPADAIYEPNYETGKAVRWKISLGNDAPLGIAGIWEYRSNGPDGQPLISFSMLTINADDHPLMQRFHKPEDEKRMVVILRPDEYESWLHAPSEQVTSFLTQFPAEELAAREATKPGAKKAAKPTSSPASLF